MWTNDRHSYRHFFYQAWKKYQTHEILTPLETQIAHIILAHPEYHFIFADASLQDQDYFPSLGDANPFLHLSLHLGLYEQLATNRPVGINAVYQSLLAQNKDPGHVEHLMIERMSEMLRQAAQGQVLDDAAYLNELKKLII